MCRSPSSRHCRNTRMNARALWMTDPGMIWIRRWVAKYKHFKICWCYILGVMQIDQMHQPTERIWRYSNDLYYPPKPCVRSNFLQIYSDVIWAATHRLSHSNASVALPLAVVVPALISIIIIFCSVPAANVDSPSGSSAVYCACKFRSFCLHTHTHARMKITILWQSHFLHRHMIS